MRHAWFSLARHDEASDKAAADQAAAAQVAADKATADKAAADKANDFKPIASQAELDAVMADRLRRQKAQFADYDALKAKAARIDEIDAKNLTDLERETAARVAAETARDEALSRVQKATLRSAVIAAASTAGAIDPSDIVALLPADAVTISDDGTVTGAAEAVAALLLAKPHLKGTARPSGDIGQGPRGDGKATDLRHADKATLDAELKKLGVSRW
jgi:hypothetical protein